MILDSLQHWKSYASYASRMAAGFEYLEKTNLPGLAPGRHAVQGDDVYAVVQEMKTKPREQGKWEAHRRYIDIQYVFAGLERMGYANLDDLKVTHPYEEKDDYLLLEGDGSFFLVRPGQFAVFGPQDAHMPGLAPDAPGTVRKVVVKVRMD
ncbi:MAG: YhcH/YjgK/YiaL family protein [Planctomycetes bacterium]|nr:YhcH/YjgK/YiaL family protein [Planctomycetota bacterium]